MSSLPRFVSSLPVLSIHYDVAAGVVAVRPAAVSEVVEEDIVLHHDVGDAVDVNMLVGTGLVVEEVVLYENAARAVVDFKDVVIVAVVQHVVTQHNAADEIAPPAGPIRFWIIITKASAPGPL